MSAVSMGLLAASLIACGTKDTGDGVVTTPQVPTTPTGVPTTTDTGGTDTDSGDTSEPSDTSDTSESSDTAGTSDTATGPMKTPKVLILGFDGLRNDSMLLANTPSLDSLMKGGATSDEAYASDLTWSGPGWASILTGVWWDKHWMTDNYPSWTNIDAYPDLFVRMKEHDPSLVGASYVSWLPINDYILTGPDEMFGRDYEKDGDAAVLAEASAALSDPAFNPDLVFVYFADIDVVGHSLGWTSASYMGEVESNDADVGVLLEALALRPTYDEEDWLILVSSDHGGTDYGHGSDILEHRNIPFIAAGPSVIPQEIYPAPNQTDIAVTALTHLGVPIDPAWDLDGRVVGITPPEPPLIALGENLIRNGDAEFSRPALEEDHNLIAPYWLDWNEVTVFGYDLLPAYPTSSDPGPKDRGRSYFCGGFGHGNSIEQVVDLSALTADISTGAVGYTLSGYLGGYSSQNDGVVLSVAFYDSKPYKGTAVVLEHATLGPVTAADRKNQTGLLFRSTTGSVPATATHALVTMTTSLISGSLSDGYADDLSLVLE